MFNSLIEKNEVYISYTKGNLLKNKYNENIVGSVYNDCSPKLD